MSLIYCSNKIKSKVLFDCTITVIWRKSANLTNGNPSVGIEHLVLFLVLRKILFGSPLMINLLDHKVHYFIRILYGSPLINVHTFHLIRLATVSIE